MVGGILDWWAVPHLAFFIVLSSTLEALKGTRSHPWAWHRHLVLYLFLSFGWELVEYFLQRKYTEAWSHVIESPWNSWIIDPASNGLGYIIGYKVARWSKNQK